MAQLKLIDESKAVLFSFSQECKTTQAAQDELIARGWTNGDALEHIEASIRAGAYAKGVDTPRAESPKGEEK